MNKEKFSVSFPEMDYRNPALGEYEVSSDKIVKYKNKY